MFPKLEINSSGLLAILKICIGRELCALDPKERDIFDFSDFKIHFGTTKPDLWAQMVRTDTKYCLYGGEPQPRGRETS